MVTSSELACISTNTKPIGTRKATANGHCGVCGGAIRAGDLVDDMVFGASFSNHNELADEMADDKCGYCAAILSNTKFILNFSTCVYTKKEAFPFGKKINRAWFLINPPTPPFAITVQATKSQHVVWRAPVSLSKEVFYVQLGDNTLKIRHKFLMNAINTTTLLRDAYEKQLEDIAFKTKKKAKKTDRNKLRPLNYGEMKGQMLKLGQLQYWVKKLIKEGYVTEKDIASLKALNWGEAWALDTASTEGNAAPEKPDTLK